MPYNGQGANEEIFDLTNTKADLVKNKKSP